ncbi:ATP-binding protein [Jeongeupia sp. USM3]|uniref:ATP-binding protein n=1 Tax=Jeongeupia sp. USM3 TaxID=1906741 RepID=UPI00089DFE34|nr:ATP-binding protein [Jeongeupia sp. USM3]AOY00416.1 hypothetical protein BJP62_08170 [Jeongeupia sp. USM3]
MSRPARVLLWLAALAAAAGLLWLLAAWGERAETERLREAGRHRLDVYAGSLRNAVDRYAYLPFALSTHPDLAALLRAPDDAALRDKVNRYLIINKASAQASVLYLLDAQGTAIAASNWDTPQSYVGRNYSFRPYFLQAREGHGGRFYGVGFTTRQPGYFLSYPVFDGRKVIGVVVAKVSLDGLEHNWRQGGERMLVADRHGVAFLSTDADWLWHSLTPLPAETLRFIEDTRQYGRADFPVLALKQRQPLDADTERATGPRGSEVLVQTLNLPDLEWRIVLFSDLAPVRQVVRNTVTGGALGLLALLSWLLFWRQRRRRIRDNLRASAALRQAHDELEHKVDARTRDLVDANAQLQREIAERIRTETNLRAAQNELIQAGKLAVLGQMAAGVTHELNQPLTAMRSFAENALALLDRGDTGEVRRNLGLIAQLTERMGKITGQLRAFARKSDGKVEPVLVHAAIGNALLLLEQRLRQQQVRLDIDQPDTGLRVSGNPVRLEQVLINLLRNALDAVRTSPQPAIRIGVAASGDHVGITVSDNGPGIAEAQLPAIFDPFFTTKSASEGLGLGLAISLSIVRDFGGRLTAGNRPEGGAYFKVELSAVDWRP